MNKNEIKQIILEEIQAAINEQTEDERIAQAMEAGDEDELENLAAGALDRAEQEVVDTLTKDYEGDIDDEDIAAISKDWNDEQDAMFGKPSFVEEEDLAEVKIPPSTVAAIDDKIQKDPTFRKQVQDAAAKAQRGDSKDLALIMGGIPLKEMARTSNVFKLKGNHTYDEVLRFMERVNNILKTYKTPGQKRPKKRFSAEDMKKVATALTSSSGFNSKDIRLAVDAYNSPAQANKFIKALEMKGYIELTSQLKKSMEPTRDPDAPETRGRKRRDAEFDMSDDPMADLDALGLGGNIDLSDPLAETAASNLEIKSLAKKIFLTLKSKGLKQIKLVAMDLGDKMDFGKAGKIIGDISDPNNSHAAIFYGDFIDLVVAGPDKNTVEGFITGIKGAFPKFEYSNPESKTGINWNPNGHTVSIRINPGKTTSENKTTMSELEKYIKQVIKEAKNPLAAKMKEVEIQGRTAALETKLSAIAEMIEETEGRLTRIDEDNEFRDMMDKGAVKEVRKQLKELERAQAKLQKEYDKVSGGRKKTRVVDEVDADALRGLADEQDALDQKAEDSMEEVSFELNESTLRFQKLAGLITESDIKKKLSLNENIEQIFKDTYDGWADGYHGDPDDIAEFLFDEEEQTDDQNDIGDRIPNFRAMQAYLRKNKQFIDTIPGYTDDLQFGEPVEVEDFKIIFTLEPNGKDIKMVSGPVSKMG